MKLKPNDRQGSHGSQTTEPPHPPAVDQDPHHSQWACHRRLDEPVLSSAIQEVLACEVFAPEPSKPQLSAALPPAGQIRTNKRAVGLLPATLWGLGLGLLLGLIAGMRMRASRVPGLKTGRAQGAD